MQKFMRARKEAFRIQVHGGGNDTMLRMLRMVNH